MKMKETLLELLTWEPFGKFLPEEETYICKILSEKKYYLPPSMIHYGSYYRGFYAPFQLGETQKVYRVPKETPIPDTKELYVILFDFEKVKKKYKSQKETSEMLVVNFNCLPAIPLHDSAVVLPFKEFLKYAGAGSADAAAGMAYPEIVQAAIDWRKKNIEDNYTGGAYV